MFFHILSNFMNGQDKNQNQCNLQIVSKDNSQDFEMIMFIQGWAVFAFWCDGVYPCLIHFFLGFEKSKFIKISFQI